MNAETKLLALREIRATLQTGIAEAEAAFKLAEQAYQQAGQAVGQKRAGAVEIDGQLKLLEAEVGMNHAATLKEGPVHGRWAGQTTDHLVEAAVPQDAESQATG